MFVIDTTQLAVSIICVILISGVSTVGNICVFLVFYCRKDIRTTTNYFFASLTFSNLVVGLFYPVQCLTDLGIVTTRAVCLPVLCALLVMGYIIIWSLLALTVERYLIITRPLTAYQLISEKRAIAIILTIFIFGIICGAVIPALLSKWNPRVHDEATTICRFADLLPSTVYRFFLVANRFISVLVFVVVYTRIFITVRRHMRVISAQIPVIPEPSSQGAPNLRQGARRWKRELKPTILISAIVLFHSLSWIPQAFALSESAENSFIFLTIFFTYCATALNPVIYGLGNRSFATL